MVTCSMSMPLDSTFVVIRIFSSPSRNLSSTLRRSSTVSSPERSATACPSAVIFSTSQLTVFLVWQKIIACKVAVTHGGVSPPTCPMVITP